MAREIDGVWKSAMQIAYDNAVDERPTPEEELEARQELEQEDRTFWQRLVDQHKKLPAAKFVGEHRRYILGAAADTAFGKQVEEADEIFDRLPRNYN
jgi:hypothetical protein